MPSERPKLDVAWIAIGIIAFGAFVFLLLERSVADGDSDGLIPRNEPGENESAASLFLDGEARTGNGPGSAPSSGRPGLRTFLQDAATARDAEAMEAALERLAELQEQDAGRFEGEPSASLFQAVIEAALRFEADVPIVERGLGLLLRHDPEAFRARMAGIAKRSDAGIGLLGGALAHLNDLPREEGLEFLRTMARSQWKRLEEGGRLEETDRLQREYFVEGTTKELLRRMRPAELGRLLTGVETRPDDRLLIGATALAEGHLTDGSVRKGDLATLADRMAEDLRAGLGETHQGSPAIPERQLQLILALPADARRSPLRKLLKKGNLPRSLLIEAAVHLQVQEESELLRLCRNQLQK